MSLELKRFSIVGWRDEFGFAREFDPCTYAALLLTDGAPSFFAVAYMLCIFAIFEYWPIFLVSRSRELLVLCYGAAFLGIALARELEVAASNLLFVGQSALAIAAHSSSCLKS